MIACTNVLCTTSSNSRTFIHYPGDASFYVFLVYRQKLFLFQLRFSSVQWNEQEGNMLRNSKSQPASSHNRATMHINEGKYHVHIFLLLMKQLNQDGRGKKKTFKKIKCAYPH